jgi:tetratricopeptide (TPR) repeat protein
LQDCIQAIKLDPTFTKAYFRAAKCQVHLGNLNDALEQLKAALAQGNANTKIIITDLKKAVDAEVIETNMKVRTIESIQRYLQRYTEYTEKKSHEDALKMIEMTMILVDPTLRGSGLPNCTTA